MIVDNHVFFIKRQRVYLRSMRRIFGVKNKSYAASIIERIYDYYCRNAINLFWTYRRYYKREFPTYIEFLEKKYNLFPHEVEHLESKLLHYKDLTFQPENNITSLFEDNIIIKKTLKRFWGENADED